MRRDLLFRKDFHDSFNSITCSSSMENMWIGFVLYVLPYLEMKFQQKNENKKKKLCSFTSKIIDGGEGGTIILQLQRLCKFGNPFGTDKRHHYRMLLHSSPGFLWTLYAEGSMNHCKHLIFTGQCFPIIVAFLFSLFFCNRHCNCTVFLHLWKVVLFHR